MQNFAFPLTLAAALACGSALADKLPFPKAAYSADVVFDSSGHQVTGHVNIDGAKERRAVKAANGHETITIIRRDLGKLYLLQPQRHVAIEMRMAAAEAAGETGALGSDIDSLYGADATPDGQDTIAGLKTTKYHIETESSPGLKVDATVWSTDDGVIARIEGKTSVDGGGPPARMELSNVSRGPQDPQLFEVPKGTTLISPGKSDDGGAPPDGNSATDANSAADANPPSASSTPTPR